MILANFMDSSLVDLKEKGFLEDVPDLYNPNRFFSEVLHFTPHKQDLSLQSFFSDWNIELIHHPADGLSIHNCFSSLVKIRQLFRRRKVDIMRGRLPYLGSLLGCLVARQQNIPTIVSLGGDNRIGQVRSDSYLYGSRKISFGIENLVLRLSDKIIVPNRFTKSYVEKLIGKRKASKKCVRIPWRITPVNPCTERGSDIRAMFRLPEDAALVTIIGFLNRYKFTDVVFDALDDFLGRETDLSRAVFVFCGDGPLRPVGEKRFANNRFVRFLGWQQRRVVHGLLREAALVLIPMSGFVLIEAASAGRPIVTGDIEWHSEFVEDGVSGLVVPPYNCEAWSQAISRVLKDSPKANEMGARLKEKYLRNYAPDQIRQLEIALYKSMVLDACENA